ncbi:MAG: hypothetical protein ACKOWF_16200 [Chloroflexota bacterium]
MDGNRFDALARWLAVPGTRRSFAASAPASAGLAALALVGFAGPTLARKCSSTKDCPVCKRCKKGKCKPKKDGAQCSGGTCQNGRCAASCTPSCAGRECGGNGCGGSCGSCPATETCNASGICVCTPDCAGKVCGDDGCGGSCGSCTAPESCSAGACGIQPTCTPTDGLCQASCCSPLCYLDTELGLLCGYSVSGGPCYTDNDCAPGDACRGWVCVAAPGA